jgi:hypothetical protein
VLLDRARNSSMVICDNYIHTIKIHLAKMLTMKIENQLDAY